MDFQNVHPEAVIAAAEILGDLSALEMPFNVQNVLGNWLTLVGQAILTFNAQQQYFENGSGCFYGQCPQQKSSGNTAQEDIVELKAAIRQLQQEVEQLRREISLRNTEDIFMALRLLNDWGNGENS